MAKQICPDIDPPDAPVFHAFSYTRRAPAVPPCFVVTGSGEVLEGKDNYRDHIIAPGDLSPSDLSPSGLRAKVRYVAGEMERRMAALGFDWDDVTGTQMYTVADIFPVLADELVRRCATRQGLDWHFARPPIVGLDFEMDCRAVHGEAVVLS